MASTLVTSSLRRSFLIFSFYFFHVCTINTYLAELFYLNFHPLEAVSHYRDPQLQVGKNYAYLFNLKFANLTVWTHIFCSQYEWILVNNSYMYTYCRWYDRPGAVQFFWRPLYFPRLRWTGTDHWVSLWAWPRTVSWTRGTSCPYRSVSSDD